MMLALHSPKRLADALMTAGLAGITPEFAVSYIPQPGGNPTLLQPNGKLSFPDTPIDTTASAVVLSTRRSGVITVTLRSSDMLAALL